jgi:hypothetical protein
VKQYLKMNNGQLNENKRSTGYNSGLAKGGLTCFVETFVVKQTFFLRMNFNAKNPALRQAAERYLQRQDEISQTSIQLKKIKKCQPHQIFLANTQMAHLLLPLPFSLPKQNQKSHFLLPALLRAN